MNAVTKTSGTELTAEQNRAMLREKVAQLRQRGATPQRQDRQGVVFAKFDGNTGRFTAGRDHKDIDLGQQFIVSLTNSKRGYVKWEGGKVVDRKQLPILDYQDIALPEGAQMVNSNPKKPRDGWQEVGVIRAVGYKGEYDGIEVELQLSSMSGLQAFEELFAEMVDQVDRDEESFVNAIIEVEADSYENDTYNKVVWFPKFNIVGWNQWNSTEVRMLADEAGGLVEEDDPLG